MPGECAVITDPERVVHAVGKNDMDGAAVRPVAMAESRPEDFPLQHWYFENDGDGSAVTSLARMPPIEQPRIDRQHL